MNSDQKIIEYLAAILMKLSEISEKLDSSNSEAPNYQQPLENFPAFNWRSIGAEIERRDQYGAAIVIWKGKQFVRRCPSNKFGEAIWFSRCTGKDQNGENKYERLITFKKLKTEAEPLTEKVSRYLNN